MRAMHRIGLSALALALGLTLAACGDKKDAAQPSATEAAAKVNGEAIRVEQLNHELAKLGNLSPEQTKQASNQLLRSMVDQQLLYKKALDEKVESDPEVAQALESARRQILVQGYLKKLTANQAKPTDAEIADYYTKHPELFAERRIYRLQEVAIQVPPDKAEAVKAQLDHTKNLGELAEWLKAQNIPARVSQSTKAAEQLPLEVVKRLHELKDGQALTLAGPQRLNMLIIAASQTQPLTQEQAKPAIERFIANTHKREAAAAEIKQLREKAKIEYLGQYADAGKAPDANEPAVPDHAEVAPAAGDHADDKGLPGLK